MNNKKLIRLIEADLHRIVRESVNKVLKEAQLNELDPRTYVSAAEKARLRGDKDRAKKFEQGAADSWNEKFGNEDLRLLPSFSNSFYGYKKW